MAFVTKPRWSAAVLVPAALFAGHAGAGARPPGERPARVIVVAAPDAGARAALRRAAAGWNGAGLAARLRIVAADPHADVTATRGPLGDRCGRRALGCLLTTGRTRTIVLPAARPGVLPAGTGQVTILAHELGHVLGLPHRRDGCTVMRAAPSAARCGLAAARTAAAPGCRATRLRGWRCPRLETRIQLCGPTALDLAALRGAGTPPARAVRPPVCADGTRLLPSRRTLTRRRNAGLRVAIAGSRDDLLRAARRHAPPWCAGAGTLPHAARRLCALTTAP